MYAIGEPSRSRDDPDAPTYRPMSSYYYSNADIVEHSHAPDTRNFRVKHMGSRQVQEYSDHMDGHLDGPRQMLSFNGHRQYPPSSPMSGLPHRARLFLFQVTAPTPTIRLFPVIPNTRPISTISQT